MTTTNPTLLAVPIAESGNKNLIPATQATAGDGLMSQSTGFPPETALPLGAGGKAPTREDFNGAFNLLSNIAFFAQKGWIFQFDATQSYFAGCVVRDMTDGKLYECINDVSAGGSVPSADSTNWKAFSTGGSGLPVGFIVPYAGTGLAEGWLDCDGSAVSRTMYPDLFDAIGTTWGAGDGSTTFNLPRSEDLVMQGASATNPVGTYLQAGLPNIEGVLDSNFLPLSQTPTGAFSSLHPAGTTYYYGANTGTAYPSGFTFDASDSNSIYGNSDTVQPPAACVRFMIKAFDGQTPDSALIDITQYAADLANKATRSLDNLNATGEARFAHVVVDSYYDSTNGDWYRVYADGWVEQGGNGTGGPYSAPTSVTFLKPFSDDKYTLTQTCVSSANSVLYTVYAYNYSATGFYAVTSMNTTGSSITYKWYACGMGASA